MLMCREMGLLTKIGCLVPGFSGGPLTDLTCFWQFVRQKTAENVWTSANVQQTRHMLCHLSLTPMEMKTCRSVSEKHLRAKAHLRDGTALTSPLSCLVSQPCIRTLSCSPMNIPMNFSMILPLSCVFVSRGAC